MLEKIEKLSLEEKVKIYRKCIDVILSKDYIVGSNCLIDGLEFSFNDLINVCYYVVPIYGNVGEQRNFFNRYGLSLTVIDDEIQDKIYVDRLKYIYNFRENNFSKKEELKKFAKDMKIRMIDIKRLACVYATSILKINKKEYDWHILKKSRDNINAKMSYSMLFDLLLNIDDEDDVIYLIDYSNVNVLVNKNEKINSYIKDQCDDLSVEEKRQIYILLNKKIDMYKVIKENIRNKNKESIKEELLTKARNLILDYINNKYSYVSISEYCKDNNVDYSEFSNRLKQLSESKNKDDVVLYNLFKEKFDKDRKNGSTNNYNIAKTISDYIINGIVTENGVREFDLLDYYSLSNVNLRNILAESKQFLSKENIVKFSKIVSSNERLKKSILTSKNSLNSNIEFDCKKDKDGFPIPGTGRRITDDEKLLIVNTFEKYNIPMHLYNVAIDRIKNGVEVDDLLVDRIDTVKKKKSKRK